MKDADQTLAAITDVRIRALLDRLHDDAKRQDRWIYFELARFLPRFLLGKHLPWDKIASHLGKKYMAVDPSQGVFCYLLARSMGARRIIEFGTSFGVSTIYLALAVRENGGGLVIGTEMVEEKARQARENLEEAGLSEFVDIRIGDARETLLNIEAPVDMFLNDGFPPYALPVLKLVAPHIRPGGIVVTDNVGLYKAGYRKYLEYMRDPRNGFQSALLGLNEGTEFSVKVHEHGESGSQ